MSWRISFTILAFFAGLLSPLSMTLAEPDSSNDYRVLSKKEIGLSLKTVKSFISDGDDLFAKGDYSKARKKFDRARDMSRLLLGFYSDLSLSFKGIDARIPREMDKNSREVLLLLSQANLRLATLFRKTNQADLAVPLLVEVVRITSPANEEGQEAYQSLIELGFVDTPYRGGRKRL